jgi:hypothetical protein
MTRILTYFIVLTMFSGCRFEDSRVVNWVLFDLEVKRKQHCMEELISKTKETIEYTRVINELGDTIHNFLGVHADGKPRPEIIDFKVEELILFDHQKERCLLFILEVYPSNFLYDQAVVILGKKRDAGWFFESNRATVYLRFNNDDKPYSHKQLSDKVRRRIILEGLFKNKKCDIRENFLEEVWF